MTEYAEGYEKAIAIRAEEPAVKERRFSERRFLLPAMVILIGTVFVPLEFLSGEAWAALSGTITTAYLAQAGYTTVGTLKANAMTYTREESVYQQSQTPVVTQSRYQ